MMTATTLLHSIALGACLTIQAMPGTGERPCGIRRALQTLSAQKPDMPALAALTDQAAAFSAPPASVLRKASPQAFASSRTRRI